MTLVAYKEYHFQTATDAFQSRMDFRKYRLFIIVMYLSIIDICFITLLELYLIISL